MAGQPCPAVPGYRGTKAAEKPRSWKDRLVDYAEKNLISVAATIVLVIGGVMLVAYFVQIGFMPEINLASSSSILYAIAALGGILVFYTTFTLILPGLALAQLRDLTKRFSDLHLLFVSLGFSVVWFGSLAVMCDVLTLKIAVPCGYSLILILSTAGIFVDRVWYRYSDDGTIIKLDQPHSSWGARFPWGAFLGGFCTLWILASLTRWWHGNISTWEFLISVTTAAVILFTLIVRARNRKKESNQGHNPKHLASWWAANSSENPGATLFWSIVLQAILMMPSAFSVFIILQLGIQGNLSYVSMKDGLASFACILVLVSIATWFIGSAKAQNKVQVTMLMAPALLFVLLAIMGNLSAPAAFAIRVLGLGEIQAARLAVANKGCLSINEQLGQRVCSPSGDGSVTGICPVMIKSRIGSQFLLEFAPMAVQEEENTHKPVVSWATRIKNGTSGETPRTLVRRALVDKSEVLGWRTLTGFKETSVEENQVDTKSFWRVTTWIDSDGSKINDVGGKPNTDLATVLAARCGPVVPSDVRGSQPK